MGKSWDIYIVVTPCWVATRARCGCHLYCSWAVPFQRPSGPRVRHVGTYRYCWVITSSSTTRYHFFPGNSSMGWCAHESRRQRTSGRTENSGVDIHCCRFSLSRIFLKNMVYYHVLLSIGVSCRVFSLNLRYYIFNSLVRTSYELSIYHVSIGVSCRVFSQNLRYYLIHWLEQVTSFQIFALRFCWPPYCVGVG